MATDKARKRALRAQLLDNAITFANEATALLKATELVAVASGTDESMFRLLHAAAECQRAAVEGLDAADSKTEPLDNMASMLAAAMGQPRLPPDHLAPVVDFEPKDR